MPAAKGQPSGARGGPGSAEQGHGGGLGVVVVTGERLEEASIVCFSSCRQGRQWGAGGGSEEGGTLCLSGMEDRELRWKRVSGLSQVEVQG